MDDLRFDAALRALQAGTTRRAGLAGMLGVLLGSTAADGSANGKRRGVGRPGTERPCGDGSAADNRCNRNRDCCTRYCVNGGCRCKSNYMACGHGEHCCSGRCVDGRCDGGAKPEGGACEEQFNCKDGLACIKGVCTASNKAKCTRANCPGCCDGTTCRPGTSERACGAGGGACAACAVGNTCQAGICAGGGGGCTSNSQCTGATDTCIGGTCTCGGSAACSGSTPYCASAVCSQCGANSHCTGATDTCTNGICVCGGGSQICAGATPLCSAGACTTGTWGNQTIFGSGPGTAANQFDNPSRLALSADRLTAWIADQDGDRISVWTRPAAASAAWTNQTTFGTTGSGAGQLDRPIGVAVTTDGLTVLVMDSANFRVSVWTRPSAASTAWSNPTTFGSGSISNPGAVALTADGLTAVFANGGNNCVSVWTRPDAASTAWTSQSTIGAGFGSNADQLMGPAGAAVSPDGLTVWIGDSGNNRISVWTRPNAASTSWTHQTNFASGSGAIDVAVTPDGLTVFITNLVGNQVSVWTRPDDASANWTTLATFGSAGSGTDQFGYPVGVAITPDGLTALIGDSGNDRISVWTCS